MSTKTIFKRVALVAAAALAVGGISAVSANALTAPTLGGSAISSTASLTTGNYTSEVIAAGSSDKYYTISTTGGVVNYPAAPATTSLSTNGSAEVWSAGTGAIGTSNFAGSETLTVSVFSATAGTQVVTLTGSNSTAITLTITWGAPPVVSATNSIVASNSAADISGTPKTTVATEDTGLSSIYTVNTLGGGAYVLLNNNASTPVPVTTDVISASVSGPGILQIGATYAAAAAATGGRAVSNPAAGSTAYVLIFGDGTSGTSTVTVSDSTVGVVLGTFSVIFHSTVIASLVAKTNTNVPLTVPAGFVATATEGINSSSVAAGMAAVSVVAKDVNGNAIPSATGITVTSGTPAVANVGALTYDAANASSFVNIIPVSEGSTILTFSDTATGKVIATTTVLVVSPVVAKVVASTDAATYDPGTKVVYSLIATDAAGRQVADGTYTGLFSTAPTSNVGLQGALPTTGAITFAAGVTSSTVYSPVTASNVVIAGGTLSSLAFVASAAAGTTVNNALFSVSGASISIQGAIDAANEATNAAKAAGAEATLAVTAANAATAAAQAAGAQAAACIAAIAVVNARMTAVMSKEAALIALVVRLIKKAHA